LVAKKRGEGHKNLRFDLINRGRKKEKGWKKKGGRKNPERTKVSGGVLEGEGMPGKKVVKSLHRPHNQKKGKKKGEETILLRAPAW